MTIDFITNLPRTTKQHDSIMVVVDKLTKAAHFIPVKLTQKEANIVDICMKEISSFMVCLRQLFITDIPSSHQTFGRDYSKDLGQI
jgi:hypothetical protein